MVTAPPVVPGAAPPVAPLAVPPVVPGAAPPVVPGGVLEGLVDGFRFARAGWVR